MIRVETGCDELVDGKEDGPGVSRCAGNPFSCVYLRTQL